MKLRLIIFIVRFLLKATPGYHLHRDPRRKKISEPVIYAEGKE